MIQRLQLYKLSTLNWKSLNSATQHCTHLHQYNNNNNNATALQNNKTLLKPHDITDLGINFARCTTATNRRRKGAGGGGTSSLQNVPITRSNRSAGSSDIQKTERIEPQNITQQFDTTQKTAGGDKLYKLRREVEKKSVKIRNLKSVLDQLHITDNIDLRIRQAELEYAVGREELQLMSLVEEMRTLKTSLEKHTSEAENLFSNLCSGVILSLHAVEAKANRWAVRNIPDASGIFVVEWSLDNDSNGLCKGDRILELNGQLVNCKTKDELKNLMRHTDKCQMVVIRKNSLSIPQQQQPQQQINQREKENSLLLQHRITYLEEQVKELQALKMEKRHKEVNNQFGHITSINISSSPPVTKPLIYQRGNYVTTLIGGKPIELLGDEKECNDTANERLNRYPRLCKSKSTSHITKTLIEGNHHHHHNHHINANTMMSLRPRSPSSDFGVERTLSSDDNNSFSRLYQSGTRSKEDIKQSDKLERQLYNVYNDKPLHSHNILNNLDRSYMIDGKKCTNLINNIDMSTNQRPTPPKKPLRLSLSLQRTPNIQVALHHNADME